MTNEELGAIALRLIPEEFDVYLAVIVALVGRLVKDFDVDEPLEQLVTAHKADDSRMEMAPLLGETAEWIQMLKATNGKVL